MSSENVSRHKVKKIKVSGIELEVITLENSSQIAFHGSDCELSKTFWIDLAFEVESALKVELVSMALISRNNEWYSTLIHIIHRPHAEADANPFDKETSVAINGHCGLAHTKPLS